MIYGNISKQSRRPTIAGSHRFLNPVRPNPAGDRSSLNMRGSEDNNFRMSIALQLEQVENYFSQRQSIQLNIPKLPEQETTKPSILSWFIGESIEETLYLNSPWLYRFLRFLIFYTVGIVFYQKIEGWDFQDCVNFITQTMTTVGYGNITPSTDHGKTFTCFYAISGILLVYSTLTDIASFIVYAVREQYGPPKKLNKIQVVVRAVLNMIMWGIILYLIPLVGGAIFGYLEGWDYRSSFYFSVITSASIGYGDYTTSTSTGVWFNLFYILFSCSMTGVALDKISSFKRHMEDAELKQILNEIEPTSELMDAIDKSDPLKVTRGEYILHMLQLEGKLDYRQDMLKWSKRFDEFDLDTDNYLTMRDVITFGERKRLEENNASLNEIFQNGRDTNENSSNNDEESQSSNRINSNSSNSSSNNSNKPRRGSMIPFSDMFMSDRDSRDSNNSTSSSLSTSSTISKQGRKKSLLIQITEETRDVFLETLYPQKGDTENEEDRRPKEQQHTSPLRSALALRRASSQHLEASPIRSHGGGENEVEMSIVRSTSLNRRGSNMNTSTTPTTDGTSTRSTSPMRNPHEQQEVASSSTNPMHPLQRNGVRRGSQFTDES